MPVCYNLYLFATCVILMHLWLFFVITQNTYLNKTRLKLINISQRDNVTLIVGCINLVCPVHCKKRKAIFASLAGMSITKLSLGGGGG
jgi:hypothetical protein